MLLFTIKVDFTEIWQNCPFFFGNMLQHKQKKYFVKSTIRIISYLDCFHEIFAKNLLE